VVDMCDDAEVSDVFHGAQRYKKNQRKNKKDPYLYPTM
jgi:hypothetical protein